MTSSTTSVKDSPPEIRPTSSTQPPTKPAKQPPRRIVRVDRQKITTPQPKTVPETINTTPAHRGFEAPLQGKALYKKVLGSGKGSKAHEITQATLITKTWFVMSEIKAGEYHSEKERWDENGGGLNTQEMGHLFISKKSGQTLSDVLCVAFFNQKVIPLWEHVSGKTGLNDKVTMGDTVIKNREELVNLMWLLKQCIEIPELDLGITLTPREPGDNHPNH